MKKYVCLISLFLLFCLPLSACNKNNDEAPSDYVATEMNCVVSLPQEYDIFYDNDEINLSMFDKDLYNAKTVNGKPKKENFRYYNVLKNEPFRILTPLGNIQNKNSIGQTLVYWQLNDTLYKDGDNYYSANIFTCNKDTEITPVYYEFRTVGILFFAVDENDTSIDLDSKFFDNYGAIIEQDDVYYLYGVYDFEPNREFWRTNLTLNNWQIHYSDRQVAVNYSKDFYSITIEIDSGKLFNKDQLIVYKLCKIDGHGYMVYGAKNIINSESANIGIRTFPIGENEIKYSFA